MADSKYRWYVLTLGAATFTLVMGMPTMSLSVLLPEISAELGLDLVQVGVVWGISSLIGIVMALMGGVIGDRIGAKRTLAIACMLTGLLGALRGLSTGFAMLALTSLIFGLVPVAIPTNVHKTAGIWFSGPQLGLANGIVSTGMALGFMLGSLLAANVLSPWLGGWRGVLYLYGVIAIVVGGIWATTRAAPAGVDVSARAAGKPSVRRGLAHVVRIEPLWFLALAMFGIGGCIQGSLGYLPIYLREVGWPPAQADAALATFHAMSLVCTIPIALLSDRLGVRYNLLLVAALMIATGIGLLAVVEGAMVLVAIVLAGSVRDGFMAVLMTSIIEIPGVGGLWAGTATGVIMATNMLGTVLSPPLGNSLARIAPGAPFVFWSALALVGFTGLLLAKGAIRRRRLEMQQATIESGASIPS